MGWVEPLLTLCVYVSVHMSVCLSICQSVRLSVCLSLCLSELVPCPTGCQGAPTLNGLLARLPQQ